MEEIIFWETTEYGGGGGGKDKLWYIGSAVLIVLVLSIVARNPLLGILGVILGAVIALIGIKNSRKFKCSAAADGIRIDSVLHPYKELETFSVHETSPAEKYLILKPKKKISLAIKVLLPENVDSEKISAILKKHLKEEKHEETLIETIARVIKF